MRIVLAPCFLAGLLLLSACGAGRATDKDIVVGVEASCYTLSDYTELRGKTCEIDEAGVFGLRKLVTVRAGAEAVYTVSVPFEQDVKLGDEWPPK